MSSDDPHTALHLFGQRCELSAGRSPDTAAERRVSDEGDVEPLHGDFVEDHGHVKQVSSTRFSVLFKGNPTPWVKLCLF